MNEKLNAHLTDEVLNEFLDQALDQPAQAAAQAHLAACSPCTARLAELRAVFVSLAALPDRPPERDLAPGVMAAVRRHPAWVPARAGARRPRLGSLRRPGITAVFGGLQVLAALVLLAFAWPFVTSFAGTWPAPAFTGVTMELASAVERIIALLSDSRALGSIAQHWLQDSVGHLYLPATPLLQPHAVGLGLAAVGAVWLLGNALLLSGRRWANTRRHS